MTEVSVGSARTDSRSTATPTIILVHGAGVGAWMWKPVQERLADFRCLSADLPGDRPDVNGELFSFSAAAQALAELIRHRAPGGRAHVVGLSLGAQTVLQLLATAPELVDRAIVTGTLTRPLPLLRHRWLVAALLAPYMPFRNLGWLVNWNMRVLGIPSGYREHFAADTRRQTTASLAAMLAANASFTLSRELGDAHAPTLVLAGARERLIIRHSMADITRVLPSARAYIVQGATHNWPLSTPKLFSRVVGAWITAGALPPELRPPGDHERADGPTGGPLTA